MEFAGRVPTCRRCGRRGLLNQGVAVILVVGKPHLHPGEHAAAQKKRVNLRAVDVFGSHRIARMGEQVLEIKPPSSCTVGRSTDTLKCCLGRMRYGYSEVGASFTGRWCRGLKVSQHSSQRYRGNRGSRSGLWRRWTEDGQCMAGIFQEADERADVDEETRQKGPF